MVLSQVPRHSRRDFTVKVGASACGILGALNSPDAVPCEIIDFSPPPLAAAKPSANDDSFKLLSMLASEIQNTHGQAIDFTPDGNAQNVQRVGANYLEKISESDQVDLRGKERLLLIESMRRSLAEAQDAELFDAGEDGFGDGSLAASSSDIENNWMAGSSSELGSIGLESSSQLPDSRRMHLRVEVLSCGKRIETFDNGSVICKDELGRVTEIFSCYGDSLYFAYGECGELFSFKRTNKSGQIHSTGQKGRNSVTVRDDEGRVKAIGQCMSVDPWGCFYLHSKDGQYFCLDLVGGIHSERRRLFNADGNVEYITSAFAHDGFRMATLYASANHAKALAESVFRSATYRFYGRDGTAVEFVSDDHLRESRPSRTSPPGSFPVNAKWIHARQAHTAWESVKEYLSRVS